MSKKRLLAVAMASMLGVSANSFAETYYIFNITNQFENNTAFQSLFAPTFSVEPLYAADDTSSDEEEATYCATWANIDDPASQVYQYVSPGKSFSETVGRNTSALQGPAHCWGRDSSYASFAMTSTYFQHLATILYVGSQSSHQVIYDRGDNFALASGSINTMNAPLSITPNKVTVTNTGHAPSVTVNVQRIATIQKSNKLYYPLYKAVISGATFSEALDSSRYAFPSSVVLTPYNVSYVDTNKHGSPLGNLVSPTGVDFLYKKDNAIMQFIPHKVAFYYVGKTGYKQAAQATDNGQLNIEQHVADVPRGASDSQTSTHVISWPLNDKSQVGNLLQVHPDGNLTVDGHPCTYAQMFSGSNSQCHLTLTFAPQTPGISKKHDEVETGNLSTTAYANGLEQAPFYVELTEDNHHDCVVGTAACDPQLAYLYQYIYFTNNIDQQDGFNGVVTNDMERTQTAPNYEGNNVEITQTPGAYPYALSQKTAAMIASQPYQFFVSALPSFVTNGSSRNVTLYAHLNFYDSDPQKNPLPGQPTSQVGLVGESTANGLTVTFTAPSSGAPATEDSHFYLKSGNNSWTQEGANAADTSDKDQASDFLHTLTFTAPVVSEPSFNANAPTSTAGLEYLVFPWLADVYPSPKSRDYATMPFPNVVYETNMAPIVYCSSDDDESLSGIMNYDADTDPSVSSDNVELGTWGTDTSGFAYANCHGAHQVFVNMTIMSMYGNLFTYPYPSKIE